MRTEILIIHAGRNDPPLIREGGNWITTIGTTVDGSRTDKAKRLACLRPGTTS